jgi:MSHA biogenesis protein MshN
MAPPAPLALAAPVPSAPPKALAGKLDAPPAESVAAAVPKARNAKTYSRQQLEGNLFSEALELDRQGRQEEAKAPLRRALDLNPLDVEARQMLIQLQFDTGRDDEALALLKEGHRLMPAQTGYTMTLSRMAQDKGDAEGALKLMQDGLPAAGEDPQYHALLAALLLRAQRYDESIPHYLVALRSDPANASWLVGVGVALEAVGKKADAAEAYRRADGTEHLAPEVAKFIDDRLAQIGH